MKKLFFKSEDGQTSVEYLLLIVVAVSLGLTFMKKLDEYVIQNPDGLVGRPLKDFQNKLNQDPRYERYPIGPMMK